MRLLLVAAFAVLTLAVAPGVAAAKTTPDFTFKHGSANYRTSPGFVPGAYQPPAPRAPCPASGVPCTYEAHEFTIAPDELNSMFKVTVTWSNPGVEGTNDFDLYVYKVRADGTIDEASPVASSASGGTNQESAEKIGGGNPVEPGKYRIIVDTWAIGCCPPAIDWQGIVTFEPYVVPNTRPNAALVAPTRATAGEPITLDATGSLDPDGQIVNYAWDIDGDGDFDVDGDSPRHVERFYRGGRQHVTVRVRDDRGGVDYANQTISIAPRPGQDRVVLIPAPPGTITLDLRPRQSLAQVALRGVAGTLTCPRSCEILSRLRIDAATARRLGLGRRARTIARHVRSIGGDRSTPRVRLKPSRGVLRAMRRSRGAIRATATITATAEGYAPQKFTRRVLITR
jgi:PKD domain